MPDRLDRLERTVERIARTLGDLEERIAVLESASGAVASRADGPPVPMPPGAEAHPEAAPPRPSWIAQLPYVGRTFLVLGGAFLLRALTDRGTWPTSTGVSVGLAYALTWIGLAHRDAAAQRATSAGFHGLASVLVAYPLLFEAVIRFGVLSVAQASVALAIVTAIGLGVAWRDRLPVVAWWFVTAATAAIVALLLAERRPVFFAGLLVALGWASLALAYGRGWGGPRWLVALVANLAVLRAGSASPPEPGTTGLLVSYLLSYLGTFATLTLVRRRTVGAFEMAQSAAVLLIGLGGAVHVTRVSGAGGALVGGSTLAAGALAYAAAFAFVRRRLGRGRNFFFYTTLGLVLVLTGSHLLGVVGFCTTLWGVLAVAAAFLGGRFDRVTLRAHGAVYAVATAVQSGLLAVSLDELVGRTPHRFPESPWALPALVFVGTSYALLVATRGFRRSRGLVRIPRVALSLVALLGLTGLVVHLTLEIAPDRAATDGSFVAAVRSGVLAVAAVALAFARKHARLRELGWLAVLLLAGGALKLLAEDLPAGGPLALFVTFALYGGALIVVPQLLRSSRAAAAPPRGAV